MVQEASHEEDRGRVEVDSRKGFWGGIKSFLTRGSARWSVLVGICLLVGTVVLVTEHPHQVQQLRQQLLLKNAPNANNQQQAVRQSIAGSDPILSSMGSWDDTQQVRPQQLAAVKLHTTAKPATGDAQASTDSFAEFHAATSRSFRKHHNAGSAIESPCASQCDANGYSAAVAGPTAARACVDVCLQEKGAKKGAQASLHSSMRAPASSPKGGSGSDQLGAAKRLLAQVQSQVTGQPLQGSKMAKGQMSGDLEGLVSALHVNAAELPNAEQAELQKALQLDAGMLARETKDRSQLTQSWASSVKQMRVLEAARFQNAKTLNKAALHAVSENKATMALDASVLSAAAQFEQNLGAQPSAGKLPVNAPQAKQQLDGARSAQKQILEGSQLAGEILSDEQMKWAKGKALVETQLNDATFVDPGSDVEDKYWEAVLKDAKSMPKAERSDVRLAVMSDGKLRGMQKRTYARQRKHMADLASDIRDMQAARAANAQLVASSMSKAAAQKQADTKLLAAEARYQSTIAQIGGKSKIAAPATKLTAKILRDAKEARELQLAAKAGSLMAHRYGGFDLSAVASSLTSKGEHGLSAAGTSSGGATKNRVQRAKRVPDQQRAERSAKRTLAGLAKSAQQSRRARSKTTGAQAVRAAAQGWFSPW